MGITEFASRTTDIDGLVVVTMKQIGDDRGTVRELFRASAFTDAGLDVGGPFQQLNITETNRAGLRGLHAESMTKLVAVVSGAPFGAYLDLRSGSPTHGRVVTVDLRPGTQVLVPSGVANGFQALADGTQYLYGFDREWQPGMPGQACNPLDPALGIPWPIADAVVSDKDRSAPFFADLEAT